MRHISTADLHANAAELSAAMNAGDEVMVTVNGQEYRLVASDLTRPDDPAVIEKRRAALEDLRQFRAELRGRGIRVTPEEVREWINEGRP